MDGVGGACGEPTWRRPISSILGWPGWPRPLRALEADLDSPVSKQSQRVSGRVPVADRDLGGPGSER